jgi:hypothetical protein
MPLDVSVLQQTVLPLDVSVLQQTVLPTSLFYSSRCCPGCVILQQSALPLDMSNLHQTVLSLIMSALQQPVLSQEVSSIPCGAPIHVCLQEFVLHLEVSFYTSLCQTLEVDELHVFFGFFRLSFDLFRNGFVCFGCFDTGSKHGNKSKQTEKKFYFAKQTETD